HPCHPPQAKLAEVQPRTVGVTVRHAPQCALRVEAPGVVEALEHLCGAGVLPAHQRTTVWTGVVEHVDISACCAADHEDGATGYRPADEIAWFGYFGFVTDVQPRVVEDTGDFPAVDLRGGHRRAVHPELVVLGIVDDDRGFNRNLRAETSGHAA